MGLTAKQEFPDKKKESGSEWTIRRLFPFRIAVASLSKTFLNPFDVLLGYLVLILGLSDLLGRPMSLPLFCLTGAVLFADLYERNKPTEPKVEKLKEEKK